jgi:hypothetical protein
MPAFALRLCAALCLVLAAFGAHAQNSAFSYLGWSNVTTNDATGDGQDRWQSFSTSTSFLFGPAGTRNVPSGFGTLLEARIGTQIVTPANTLTPAPGDRPAAGALRAGLFTHFARGGWDFSLGAGVEATGPATRVLALQDRFHATLGFDRLAPGVIAGQVGNRLRPMAHAEAAYAFLIDDSMILRPFATAHVGLETYARAGFDLLIGPGYRNGVIARDYVSGQPYQVLERVNEPGISVLFGADAARVFSSGFLPSPGYTLTPLRTRLRGGVLLEERLFSAFYGVTYLGPEFTAQPSGQLVGTMQFRISF